MRGRVDDPFAVRREVRAGGPALSRADEFCGGTVDVHRENLIAFVRFAGGLENDPLPIEGKVGFSVFATECELFDIPKVNFFRMKLRLLVSRLSQIQPG